MTTSPNATRFESDRFDAEFSDGELFIHDDETSTGIFITLHDDNGRDITLAQFRDCVASHGLDRACQTFMRISCFHTSTTDLT